MGKYTWQAFGLHKCLFILVSLSDVTVAILQWIFFNKYSVSQADNGMGSIVNEPTCWIVIYLTFFKIYHQFVQRYEFLSDSDEVAIIGIW